ncbi:MAG: PD-(D/E)XK nuclease family protein [Acidobacteriota bacterium]
MSDPAIARIWYAREPQSWPSPPTLMSVSRLLEIEACPRRWALSSASYPEIWKRSGYPQKVYKATLAGRIIHLALERISKALTEAGYASGQDALFVEVMRKLGGFTQVIVECIGSVVDQLADNPRVGYSYRTLSNWLRDQSPAFRERVQILAGRLRVQPKTAADQTRKERSGERSPLRKGSYSEVELRAESIGWIGIADLITLSDNGCEIVDFKTGGPKPEHSFQLLVYSLLWYRDQELNPMRHSATKLTLYYPDGEVDVRTISDSEISDFESDLLKRTRAAIESVKKLPPEARPSVQNCRFCGVRQLCDEYWKPATQERLYQSKAEAGESSVDNLLDIEVDIVEQIGPLSWDAIMTSCNALLSGDRFKLHLTEADSTKQMILEERRRIRILDAYWLEKPEDSTHIPLVGLSRLTEMFLL